jgi:hypothetical protein
MTNTFFSDNATLMSPRTAKYVEAMIREGDNFDYDEWLKRVREEEAEAKQAEVTGTSRVETPAKLSRPLSTPENGHTRPIAASACMPKALHLPRALHAPNRQPKSQVPKARLRRWLEKVRGAWDEFQVSRARDAVYGYLEAVFAIVQHYRVRRRTKRLLRHAFEFADLPFNKHADPFSAVIRCTSGNTVDTKMISKWSRALRYASRRKEPDLRLKGVMKEMGGINACADRYAMHCVRNHRR